MRDATARFFYELREGGRRQGNVLFALIFKNIKSRTGRDYTLGLYSLAGAILEPAIGAFVVAAFWYIIRREEIGGVHVALFVAVSYTPFSIFRRSLTTIPRSLRANQAFYAYQQVKPFDSITAQFVIEVTLILIGGTLLMFALWWFLDLSIKTDQIPQFLGMLALMAVSGFGMSLFLGTYGMIYPVIMKIVGTFSVGMMFLCAVMHPLSELPTKASYALSWNPIVHIEEKLREYGLGMEPDPNITLAYPMGFALTMLFLGFVAYYANRFRVLER